MKKYFLIIFASLFIGHVMADEPAIALDKAPINQFDMDSIKRGAKFFATNCMMCHTLIYMRYNEVANQAGITYEKMPVNVKDWPFGVTPPDLSLETDKRSPDWVYTYLHSFYADAARPTGFNNLLVPNTAMPGIIAAYEGKLVLSDDLSKSQHLYGNLPEWYDVLTMQAQGSMTPQQFDATVTDVVNFLAYSAEPFYQEQIHLGMWVMVFLVIFFIFAYNLKQEYWADIKKNKKK